MRVVVVIPWEPWRTGDGVVLPLFHHLQRLSPSHDITVLAASGGEVEERVVGPQRGLPEGLVVRWFGTGLSPAVDHLQRRLRGTLRGEPAHALFVERPGLLRALREEARGADVLHLVGWGTAQLARLVDVPAVHVAVDPWAQSWRNRRLPTWRRALDRDQVALIRRHERRHYPGCSRVVVVAEPDADLLRAHVPGIRVEVVPNGVTAGPAPVAPPVRPVLGLHGSFETQANVDGARALVEQVWPLVRAQVPGVEVLLAGRAPGPEVRGLAGLGVHVEADVPSIRDVLDRTSVHVSWMTSGLGMKNKVLEALAAGRPVVANPLGASGIGAGPGLQVASDPQAAADLLVALLRDPVACAAWGLAGRARVEADHSWTASATAMERVWREAAR